MESISRECRATPAEIIAFENGDREPSAYQFFNLAATYNLHQEWSFGSTGTQDTDEHRAPQYADVAEQISEAREKAGLSVYPAAQVLKVPISDWEEIEQGVRMLDFAFGVRACTLFGVNATDLVRPAE